MADLAIGLAKTVVEGALTRAQSAIEEETRLRLSTQQDLVFITGEFEMMHSFLEAANTERVRNNVVKTWVRQVRDLAYDVEDCIEFVVHLDDSDGPTKWIFRMLPSCLLAKPMPLDVAVAEIAQLKARVEDVSCRNSRYNLISDSGSKPVVVKQQKTDDPDAAVTVTMTASAVDTMSEARDSTAKKQPGLGDLTQLITKIGSELGVISVWARSDDLGTSMSVIRKAYEDEEIRKNFWCRGWVKLEYPFNPRKFQQSVLAQFYTNTCLKQGKSVDVVELERREATVLKQGGFAEEFKAQVNNKRYLLVLENVCTMGDWDAIRACLPESVSSNRIIVSTEQREVARLCIGHSYQVLELKQYSADHPVCVFFKQERRPDPPRPPRFAWTSTRRAAWTSMTTSTSSGTPLSPSAGREEGRRRRARGKEEDAQGSHGEIDRAMSTDVIHDVTNKVLRKKPSSTVKDIKYENLKQLILKCGGLPKLFDWMHCFFLCCPDYLRPCIFYLSIFPGYQIIRRRRLLMRWVAEGYSRDTKDNTAEERAEMLFSMLVNLSMIQPPPCTVMTPMRMVKCQVSAFFHEYIISRPEEDNIVFALEVFELKGKCRPSTRRTGRHLVIQSDWDRDMIVYDSIDFSKLRSLTVFGEWKSFFVSKGMKVLRVLDLEDASKVTDKDLEEIVNLLPRLKFLSLRGRSEINRLPSSLGELRQLETLDIRGTSIDTLPASITKLKKLQYIRAGATSLTEERSCASKPWFPFLCRPRQLGVEVPAGIDKLTALHTLGIVNIATAPHKATLEELKILTQLRKLGVSGVNKKNCKEVSAAIQCHVHLESLSLWLSKGDQRSCGDISPSTDLKTLKLYGLVDFVPLWIKDLHKITKLELEMTISDKWVDESGIIGILGDMKELTVLRLSVKPHQDGEGNKLDFCVWLNGIQNSCYLRVKILEVASSSNLNLVFGSHSMQNLELLTVRCSSASALQFFQLKSLSNLKEVQLIGAQGRIPEELRTQLIEHPKKPALKAE
ncbi:hypothetical protein HU200_034698 [Digitaria exilis]|uniref:Rx N-terminal domain-containing protein n=1 Tax=Digitaria exilis TaxID=1010633 RepID=A0A835BJH2_9POAL|nr:hypothetical protein HU200_034698 [Digitaria exilis]